MKIAKIVCIWTLSNLNKISYQICGVCVYVNILRENQKDTSDEHIKGDII